MIRRRRINRLLAESLGVSLLLGLALIPGCASINDSQAVPGVSATQYATYGAVSRVQYVHLLNIADSQKLRTSLEELLSYDVLALGSLLQNPISDEERRRVYQTLRLIAIQNEKFPMPGLTKDPEVKAILQSAVANDPAHTANLRARNWNKPMWQE